MQKKLKIGLGVILSVLLIVSLTSCGDSSDSQTVPDTYQIALEVVEGEGSVNLNPDKDSYEKGEEVSVTADPDDNWLFSNWSGSISSENKTETIIVDSNMTIGAVFEVDYHVTGQGTETNPYRIYTAEGLRMIEDDYEAYYELARDIDLDEVENWDPIGSLDNSPENIFSGQFDGKGYSIKNMSINTQDDFVGLFLGLFEAKVKNLEIIDAQIEGAEHIGVLTGQALYSNIINVSVKSSAISGNDYVSGLVGSMFFASSVEDSSVEAEITGEDMLGGLSSVMGSGANISTSYFDGSVYGNDKVGGLVGIIDDFEDTSSIENSYARGSVSAFGDTGGLIGVNHGNLINSYAVVNVDVAPGEPSGGAIAINEGIVEGVYYDKDISGQDDQGKGIPKTTEEMKSKSTFSEWDFDNIWSIENSYPFLE